MRLRVWLPPLAELRPDSTAEFDVLSKARRVQHRGETSLVGLPRNIPCELVLHPADAVLLEVRLPRLSAVKLASALPSLVEERLLGNADDVHVVATPRNPDGSAVAVVVDRGQLRRALDLFQKTGRDVQAVVPHVLANTYRPGHWRARIRDGAGSLRSGPAEGVAFEARGDVPLEVRLCLSQAVATPTVIEIDGDCDAHEWSEALGVAVKQVPPDDEAPPVIVNLLQYRFAPGVAGWEQWRTPALLGAMFAVVMLLGMNLHAWQLASEEEALRDRMSKLVTEYVPGTTVVLDPLAQMQRRVNDLKAGAGVDSAGFLSLMLRLSGIVDFNSVRSVEYLDEELTVEFEPEKIGGEQQRQALIGRAEEAGLSLRFASASASSLATVGWQGR